MLTDVHEDTPLDEEVWVLADGREFTQRPKHRAKVGPDGAVTASERGEAFVMARYATFTVGVQTIVLPQGFTAENMITNATINAPTAVAFVPSPPGFQHMLVGEKDGVVWTVTNGLRAATPLWDGHLEVLNDIDRGFLGLAVDPAFIVRVFEPGSTLKPFTVAAALLTVATGVAFEVEVAGTWKSDPEADTLDKIDPLELGLATAAVAVVAHGLAGHAAQNLA